MRRPFLSPLAYFLPAISTSLVLSTAAQGQALHWDTNGTEPGFGNFTGDWNGTNQFWNPDATGGAGGALTATTSPSNALNIVGIGSTGIITVTGHQTAGSIDLANSANLAALRVGFAGANNYSLTVTGNITDTGAGNADVRVVNLNAANAAAVLTAGSMSTGVISFAEEGFGNAQFWTTGYDMTAFTQFGIGRGNGNSIYRQTGGTVTVNATDRGIIFFPGAGTAVNSGNFTASYIMDGGTLRASRVGVASMDGNNNANDVWAGNGRLEFNNGTIQNNIPNGTLNLQNGSAFMDYDGSVPKDMQLDTRRPLTVHLAAAGTHTFHTDGANSRIIVTPSAQIVDKPGEAGTLTKSGLGNLVFTGNGPVAMNSWTGRTTATSGKVMTDYSLIAGQAATGSNDSLNNAFSAASQLVLDGGNYELKGRSSAKAQSKTGVTLPAGTSGTAYTVKVDSTTDLVIGQSITHAKLPASTYIRRIIDGTRIELNAMNTAITEQTDQTLVFGAATFANAQTINDVVLQQEGSGTTITVTSGAGSSSTLLTIGNVSGSGGFTKTGTGTLGMIGNLTYTGGTAVNSGTLLIEGNGSEATGTISVAAGATLALGPSAVLGGPVISSGRILPGTYHTNLTLGSTSRVPFKVNSTADHDKFTNDGGDTLAFENNTTLELDFTGYTPTVGDTFTLFPDWAARTGIATTVLIMTTGLDRQYALDATNLLANGSVSLRTVASSPIIKRPDGTLVRISNGGRFYPVGFNFIRLNNQEQGHHSTFHISDYDGPAATAMFQRLVRAGYTAVRVFVNSSTNSQSGIGWQTSLTKPLNPTYLDHFADFLKRAAAQGILVQASMPPFPWNNRYASLIGPSLPMITGGNSVYLHPGHMAARVACLIDFWNGIRARYPDCAEALLCVDLENELNYSITEQPFSLSSGTFNAASGQSYDLATQKQDLADDMAIYWVNRMCATVRSILPTTLINTNVFSYYAVGRTGPGDFRVFGAGWKDRVPFRPRALAASDTDIVDLHFYWKTLAESPADFASIEFDTFKTEALAAGKVLTIGEFGSLYYHIPANDPASALVSLPAMANHFIDQGFQGWLLWTYDGIEQANHHLATDANFAIFNHLAQEIPGPTGPQLADNFTESSFAQEWLQTTPASWSVSGGAATLANISGLQQIYQYQDQKIFTDFRANTRFQFTGNGTGRGGINFRKQETETPAGATGYTASMTAAGQVTLDVYNPSTATSITLGSIQTAIDPFSDFVDLTIEAVGTRIKVWANGTLCLDVIDDCRSAGYTSFFFEDIAGKIDLVAVNDISQLPDGATDRDGDDRTQSEEFIWGTSDTDAASFFRPAQSFQPGTGFTLTWHGLAKRRYTIWRSLTLAGGDWVSIFNSGVLHADKPLEFVDPLSLTEPKVFYKIEAEYNSP